ncbi:MAG: aconitate hydratase AcnA [Gammaproteobacteria bacterium]|nr:aconitate hydratase AcnA [Gammaproteobacteria bacterium]
METIKKQATRTLKTTAHTYQYMSLPALTQLGLADGARLPFTLKILLENLLRHLDNRTVSIEDIEALLGWAKNRYADREIAYRPARVLMQDFTGVPAIVDLAAMRDAMLKLGANPERINPLSSVDLVIDHSVQVDKFASPDAFQANVACEYERNAERYAFLRWGQTAFKNFRVVPPGTGICHQVNLEYLGRVIWQQEGWLYPDTLVGTDSHTTMINGLGILGWGVGGIEAEAAMLGQPISMLIPEVVGFKMTGQLQPGITATDLVLTVTQMLRKKGVVGSFVEFFGPGLTHLTLADRATIANMSPEFGATCGFFPVDNETLRYMKLTGRDDETIQIVERYTKEQGLWREEHSEPVFTDVLELDLASVQPCLAGPKRPQDRVPMLALKETMDKTLEEAKKDKEQAFPTTDKFDLHQGDVVIAAITSCTNTSNPSVLMAAGLLAKKAVEKGLKCKPWVKSSLAPGSKVVTDYLKKAGLQSYLDTLGFNLVGYGCTTCIGNSGPLPEAVSKVINDHDLLVSAVLSGNRNFEGRVHPQVKANWLASPPLVVAYALAGTMRINLDKEPLGRDQAGQPVYLADIWPSSQEIEREMANVSSDMFKKEYAEVFDGDAHWKNINAGVGETYRWNQQSTYVQNPPFFDQMEAMPAALSDIQSARVLALFGDSITTDHISPAGAIKADSPAGKYLQAHGVTIQDFNSYGARRGNHEVMMRGTFANIRIKNEMMNGKEGGYTRFIPGNEVMSIYDAAMRYQKQNTPLVIVAGKEYGTGSSRDWAAKGPLLLGVRAVIAESFERIHRSNLVGMGILPLEFRDGMDRNTLALTGEETFTIAGLSEELKPKAVISVLIQRPDGTTDRIMTRLRIDTANEIEYYRHGGILPYMIRSLL